MESKKLSTLFFLYILVIANSIQIFTNLNTLSRLNSSDSVVINDDKKTLCKEGYSADKGICLKNCPKSQKTSEALCIKNVYSRGLGYLTKSACESKQPLKCEKFGLLLYPVCKDGYKSVGCCNCHQNCLDGMVEVDNESCKRPI